MIIVIHDSELKPVLILDNKKQGTLNFFDDQWTRHLMTGSSVFEFSVYKKNLLGDTPLSHKYDVLNDQAFVSFINKKGKVELFNVMRIEETENKITCYCENLNLELLNEYCPAFKADKAMSLEEYFVEFDMINFGALTIGVNEVKDKKLTLEWTATETKLARLLSIVTNFDAEVEFETKLNDNYTFKMLQVNIYKEYEEGVSSGVGQDKTDRVLRYHKNIDGVTKKVDKTQIYNAVKPFGKKKVTGTRVVSNPVTKKVTKLVTNRKTYVGGDLRLQDKILKKDFVQSIIDYAVLYNILPSGLIVQLFTESLWGTSYVARVDNNWGGLTWTGQTTRPSGVTVSRGSARPANEGGYYMHFASVADYLKDYAYLLAKQGIYNVVGKKTFATFTQGLFTIGGAKYNYAAVGYDRYKISMDSLRNQINKSNNNILNTIDSIWSTPVTTTGTTVAKRATQTINVLNQIQGMKGHRVGSGQCYALSAWYAMKLNGPGLDGGVTGFRGRIGAGVAASQIGTDYAWGSYQWLLDKNPTASNLKAGGIYNVRAFAPAPIQTGVYGHTGIIKSVTDTQVTVYEQNYAGRMYVIENVYNKTAFVNTLQTVCYPREIKEGMSVTGATTQQISGGTQISYDEVVQEAQTETYEEEQIVTIDKSIYKEWKDSKGQVEFYLKDGMFYAPLSKNRYPSVLSGNETKDNWIRKDLEVDTDSPAMLETVGLRDIKAHAYPIITYEVDGWFDGDIGDIVTIQDDGYKPPLILSARVVDQVVCDTNKKASKTTFSNYVEKASQISDDLISEMLRMYDDATPYNIRLAVSNGTAFKNGIGESLLTPTLEKNGKEYDAIFAYRNGDSHLDMGPQFLVKATDFSHVLNVTVEAYINDELVASAQVSFTDTEDGTDGVGVNSVSITYGLSKSAGTQPTTWTTDLPVAGQGDYLWTRKITDYTDSTKEDTIELTYSFQGKDGVAGASLKVSKIEYQAGTSGTVAPTGAWSTTIPSVPEGQYLWSKTTLSDNSIVYGIAKQGAVGPKGDKGDTYYPHTAWANSEDGKVDFSTTESKGRRYKGDYSDTNVAGSTDPTKYKWVDMTANAKTGNNNLLINTKSLSGNYFIANNSSETYLGGTIATAKAVSGSYQDAFRQAMKIAPEGNEFIVSFYAKSSVDNVTINNHFYSPNRTIKGVSSTGALFNNSNGGDGLIAFKLTTQWKRYWIKWTIRDASTEAENTPMWLILGRNFDSVNSVYIALPALYAGNLNTEWSKAPEDVDAKIDSKADEDFTIEQLNLIAENQRLLKAENDAKASLEELNTWVNTIKEQLEAQKNGQRISEEALIEASTRVTQIQAKLGEIALVTEAITQYMSYSENGLIIGMKDGTSSVRVTTDRISFYSGGTETAFISQGFLQIESGVFTLRLQIGHYLFEEDGNGMLMIGRVI